MILALCAAWVFFRWICAFQHFVAEKAAEYAWDAGCRAEREQASADRADFQAYRDRFRAERRRREAEQAARDEAMRREMVEMKAADLILLGLETMPRSIGELKRARNIAALESHPDIVGGSGDKFHNMDDAYHRLLAELGGQHETA